ncbi:MAG: phospholipase D-like domain-containing protein [Candidatus Kariarchaeaceae archaeon]|jgi:phosphatidylserine/phosphatidylglycerophosphate/cardiolipin synthase-like enzyme
MGEDNLLSAEFPKFLQGPFLRATLTMLPSYAESQVLIMVPYLVKSEILDSIIKMSDKILIKLYTRDAKGYLPTIKKEAQPALDLLMEKKNLQIFIDNKIHAKIWLIDDKFAVVHSMNGTPTSEWSNFEAGIITINDKVISDVKNYFNSVEMNTRQIKS